jgi:hypothetical protein
MLSSGSANVAADDRGRRRAATRRRPRGGIGGRADRRQFPPESQRIAAMTACESRFFRELFVLRITSAKLASDDDTFVLQYIKV